MCENYEYDPPKRYGKDRAKVARQHTLFFCDQGQVLDMRNGGVVYSFLMIRTLDDTYMGLYSRFGREVVRACFD